ncbi:MULTISPECIES: M23 family metallopeptidase [Streptomyces]|uniref:M23 family metallopeptidase n=1 Tax=Streptomyces TaxID=1883 RepID=UPI0031D4C858
MNDRHPSAGPDRPVPAPDAPFGQGHYPSSYEQQSYAGYDGTGTGQWDTTGSWDAQGHTQTWNTSGYETYGGHPSGQWDTSGHWSDPAQSGQYDSGAWHTGSHDTGSYDTGSYGSGSYDSGQQHSGQWDQSGQSGQSGQWDTAGHGHAATWDTHGGQNTYWDASGQWGDLAAQQTQTWDTSAYADAAPAAAQPTPTLMVDLSAATADPAPAAATMADAETRAMLVIEEPEAEAPAEALPDDAPAVPLPRQARSGRRKGGAAGRAGHRPGQRPHRRALLTVAVPSVAVMGVAGIAAASVVTGGAAKDDKQTTAAAAPDASVKTAAANSKLDTQLAGLSQGADDFASRASRTQERLDLKLRQEEERKRKAEEAARKERERPKFSLPVTQHGLSAYYGQAGVNWMSVHTGIDFPVAYGTPVMAATDGTVTTQYNVAYGNMAKVTSADGTETWYCHLSSYKIRSGPVKAGDVIAYSGNSGNSTGPHLHFEVRPGGSAIDPLPWLRSHDLDPT